MSYQKTWGPIQFRPANMTCTPIEFAACGEPDTTIHVDSNGSLCFFAWANYSRGVKGNWFANPLIVYPNLISDPSATQIMLDGFSCRKLVKWGGSAGLANIASFLLNSAGTRIIDDELPGSFNGELITRNYNLPLLFNQSLEFGLYQYASAGVGSWIDQHVYEYAIWGHYYTIVPPASRTVTLYVYDSVKALPLVGVTAQLISGQTKIDEGLTDTNGTVLLNGFDTKYQVKVWATGYVPYPSIIDVDLSNSDATLQVPLQEGITPDGDGELFPWELLWIPIIGIGALGIVWMLVRRKRKDRNGITVIK